MRKILLFLFIANLTLNSSFGQEAFKTMFYNLRNFPAGTDVGSISDLEFILKHYNPDLFMVCELNNRSGYDAILNIMQQEVNPNFLAAEYVSNTSGNNNFQQMLYYDSTKFILEDQIEVRSIFRDFNHYVLKLNTVNQNNNPIILNAIVCHLKATQGSVNDRLTMVNDLTEYLEGIPSDEYVTLSGDFNLYTSDEPAYQELLDPNNNITFIDPVDRPGNWHNNTDYIDVMSQSTRSGTSGGFDDRFDFTMTTANMKDNPELQFIEESYVAYGNNANVSCYNRAINSNSCAGSEFDFEIRDALHAFSDHLPIVLTLETNEVLLDTPDTVAPAGSVYEIVGTNIVSNTLKIKVSYRTLAGKELQIFNTLGQIIKTAPIDNNGFTTINIMSLSNGLYYISTSNLNVEPLKFVKIS